VYSASATTLAIDRRSRRPRATTSGVLTLAPFVGDTEATLPAAKQASRDQVLSDTVRSAVESALPLPDSLEEVRSIASMFAGSRCYIGDGATRDVARREAARAFRFLHFATHGHLDSAQPMYSGLVLADGILQAWEIFGLDIQADMVVMSACESGLGKLRRGEGLIGLTRAFFHAGVRSLIVSLWSVSDVSTQMLMTRMYANVKDGMTPARALQEARTWLLREARRLDDFGYERTFESPFYWAPFILIGAYD
jgi:CHAT domain-containing protein